MLGFLNINKPSGMSSAQVVAIIKKKFHLSKIGHMGTLDPMASGVLPIAVGKATRLFDYFLRKEKTYLAQFEFGYKTSTLDSEGEVVERTTHIPTKKEIEHSLSSLQGEIAQIPPQFSAKNVQGTRAYDLARRGVDFVLQPKTVFIKEIRLIQQVSKTKYEFSITCSSGTYIRSIARDMGHLLGSLATMTALVRVKSGFFTINEAMRVEDIEDIRQALIRPEKVFSNIANVNLSENQFKDLQNGKKVSIKLNNGTYWLSYQNRLVGLCECVNETITMKVYLWEEE